MEKPTEEIKIEVTELKEENCIDEGCKETVDEDEMEMTIKLTKVENEDTYEESVWEKPKEREKQAKDMRVNSSGNKSRADNRCHDQLGILIGPGINLCDCLHQECFGCFFPCPSCRSVKCGNECRVNRTYIVKSIKNQVDGTTVYNPFLEFFK